MEMIHCLLKHDSTNTERESSELPELYSDYFFLIFYLQFFKSVV